MWAEELRHVELSSDVGRAEQCLQLHSDAALHVQNCIIEVMQVGQDLLPVRSNCEHLSQSSNQTETCCCQFSDLRNRFSV